MSILRSLALALLLSSSAADVTLSRTVNSLAAGSATLTIEGSACASQDNYGSNDCDVHWGQSYGLKYDATLSKDIEAGSSFTADFKLDRFVPLKFTCALCGADCTVTVPIIKKTYTLKMPSCPISSQGLRGNLTATLPSPSPVPLKIGLEGNLKATDANGNVLADIDVSGQVSPSGAAAVMVEEHEVKLAWLEA